MTQMFQFYVHQNVVKQEELTFFMIKPILQLCDSESKILSAVFRLHAPWKPNIVGDRSVFRVFSLSLPTSLEHDPKIFD